MSSSTPPSLYKYKEYLLAKRVCSVSKSGSFAKAGRIYDIAQPLGSSCRVKKERMVTRAREAATTVVMSVRSEQDQGLRSRALRREAADAIGSAEVAILLDVLGRELSLKSDAAGEFAD